MVLKGLTPLLVLALSYLPCFWSAVRVHPSNTPWTGGFSAKFSIESKATHTPWNVHIIFEVPVEHLDYWHGSVTKVNDYEYVLSDLHHEQDLQSGTSVVYLDFQAHTPGVKASPDTVICAFVAGHEPDSVCPRYGGYTLPPTAAPQTFTPAPGGFVSPSHTSGHTGRTSVSIDKGEETLQDFVEVHSNFTFIYHDFQRLLLMIHESNCYYHKIDDSARKELTDVSTGRIIYQTEVMLMVLKKSSTVQRSSLSTVRDLYGDRLADFHCLGKDIFDIQASAAHHTSSLPETTTIKTTPCRDHLVNGHKCEDVRGICGDRWSQMICAKHCGHCV